MSSAPSDLVSRSVAAASLGAAAFVAVTYCSFDPSAPDVAATGTTGGTDPTMTTTSAAAAGAAARADGRLSFALVDPINPREHDQPRAGFLLSKSGRRLATWNDCPCAADESSGLGHCSIALWDLVKRQVSSAVSGLCVARRQSLFFSPAEDLLYVSSHGWLRAHQTSDGQLRHELDESVCDAHTEISADAHKLLQVNACSRTDLYDAPKGDRISRVQVETSNENGMAEVGWNEAEDVIGLTLDDQMVTLVPLRGGSKRRVALPGNAEATSTFLSWIPGSSQLVVARSDGLLGLIPTRSGALRVLSNPSTVTVESWAFDLSESRDKLVRLGPWRVLELWDLRTYQPQELGAATWDANPSTGIELSMAPDARFVATVTYHNYLRRAGMVAIRLVPVPGSPPAVLGLQDLPRPVDVTLKNVPGAGGPVGWAGDGSFLFWNQEALLSIARTGEIRLVKRLTGSPREVRLTPNRRAVIVLGDALTWVSLADGRTATFVAFESISEGTITGHIEGVDSDADWAAMGGEAPR